MLYSRIWTQSSSEDENRLPPEYFQKLYRRHLQGAVVRSGASLLLWLVALGTYMTDIIQKVQFTGISLAVGYLILLNPPTLWILAKYKNKKIHSTTSILINLMEIAAAILTKLGYSVSTVSSGEEAIDYLKNQPVDLLVIDMVMDPGMDGLATYKAALELRPHQKAIVASGYSETESVSKTLGLGAHAYVRKPYTIEKIGLAIKETLAVGV